MKLDLPRPGIKIAAQPEKELRPQAVIRVQRVQGLILRTVTVHLVDRDQKRRAATTLLEVLDSLPLRHQGGRVVDCHRLKIRQLVATMHLEDLEGQEGQRVRPRTATMRQVGPEHQVDQGLKHQTATVHPVDLVAQLDLGQKQQAVMMLLVDLEDQTGQGVRMLRHQGTKLEAGIILMGMLDHRPPLGFTLHHRILATLKPLAVIKVQVGPELARHQASPDNQVEATVHQEKVTVGQPAKAWVAIMTQKDLGRVLVGLALVLKILTVTMTLRATMGELCQSRRVMEVLQGRETQLCFREASMTSMSPQVLLKSTEPLWKMME